MSESPACFTVVTKNYLPYARVLMERLALVEPETARYVFLADEPDGCFDPAAERFTVVPPRAYLDGDELAPMSFQYTGFELSNALKAFAHRYLNRQTGHGAWMYYDADIYPVASAWEVFAEDGAASIFLSPHVLYAGGAEAVASEANVLQWGVYNGGWLGLRRSTRTDAFLDWFVTRMKTHCFNAYRHTFVDQLWLGLVPVVMEGVHVVRHPGINLGYWNGYERPVTAHADGTLEVRGRPLLFVHFSGWDPAHPAQWTRHFPEIVPEAAVRPIMEAYADTLVRAGLPACREWPYGWSRYHDGRPIQVHERRRYADRLSDGSWPAGKSPFGSPELLIDPPPSLTRRIKRRLARLPYARTLYRQLRFQP